MSIRKFDEILPDAMSELNRMIKKGAKETGKARSGDRGAIRVKRKRERQLTLALKR